MPRDTSEKLLSATQKYLNTGDGLGLLSAFQADEIPYFLGKMF